MNAEVPEPGLVAARLVSGENVDRAPWWAAAWLAGGADGPALRELAGLGAYEPHEVRAALPDALAEMNVALPTRDEASQRILSELARMHLDGRLSERALTDLVLQVDASADSSPLVRAAYEAWEFWDLRLAMELALTPAENARVNGGLRAACRSHLAGHAGPPAPHPLM